jgi:cell division protein FtsW (lipid II flippase)/cell division protein FtsI/penicillin-binding protein 2
MLYHNSEQQFKSLQGKESLNINSHFTPDALQKILFDGNYVADRNDAQAIAHFLQERMERRRKEKKGDIPNLGQLNTSDFAMPAAYADSMGGVGLKERIAQSEKALGITDEVLATYTQQVPDRFTLDSQQSGVIKVLVRSKQDEPQPIASVLVLLRMRTRNNQDSIVGYAMTSPAGIATFAGLKANTRYSVLPVRKGYEYGSSQRVTASAKEKSCTFTQTTHWISPFDSDTFRQLKTDNALTVRTADDYMAGIWISAIWFLMAWWLFHFLLCILGKKADKPADELILPLVMTLTGICILMMYAIAYPLTDTLRGEEMARFTLIGVAVMAVVTQIDFVRFFNDQYRIPFDPILIIITLGKAGRDTSTYSRYKGTGYLLLALALVAALALWGSSPQAGVKVNLDLGPLTIQPSEIVKYAIVVFMAAIFFRLAPVILKLSGNLDKKVGRNLGYKARTILTIAAGIFLLIALDVFLIGDMGPAMVLAITFIFIYAVIRGDLMQLIIGVVTLGILLFAGAKIAPTSIGLKFTFFAAWLILWLIYGAFKKQLYESALFFNLIIMVFIAGGALPGDKGDRLNDRVEIWTNPWNNQVYGGTQVAEGIWGLATGGSFGQGLEGSPVSIAASHTDMIIPAIGEKMGLATLALILVCIFVLFHRTLLIGKQAGHPFAFYLAIGIAVVTIVQFCVITMGSIGMIPLTGVSVPFLSYGKVGLVINMAAFAVVLSISKRQGSVMQMEYIEKIEYHEQTDSQGNVTRHALSNLGVAAGAYIVASVAILASLYFYQVWARDIYLIRPVYAVDKQGTRIRDENPRIRQLMRKMQLGNIYDRNGLLLASSDRKLIEAQYRGEPEELPATVGLSKERIDNELVKHKQRYYPFGEHLFFWLGDYNTETFWGAWGDNDPRGYLSEYRHLAALRGYDIETGQADPVIPAKKRYDYQVLLPMLKEGAHGAKLKAWNERRSERDITLAVDAALQTHMQTAIAKYVQEKYSSRAWNQLRVSVVVLNAGTGDLLCSANYPLPDQDTLRKYPNAYSDNGAQYKKAYTDRDLGITYPTAPGSTAKVISSLAGFQKLGSAAKNKKYMVNAQEAIEVRGNGTPIEPTGNVTMENAIVLSSNCYFVNLVNDNDLYPQLDSIYYSVGIRLEKENGKGSITPYYIDRPRWRSEYHQEVKLIETGALRRYNNYIETRKKEKKYRKMQWGDYDWAWGQGTLRATPLNMARIASIVANGGEFRTTQYLLKGNVDLQVPPSQTIPIVSAEDAGILRGYMMKETDKHRKGYNGRTFPTDLNIGGKTGTPERDRYYDTGKRNSKGKPISVKDRRNDGWYLFFIDSPKEGKPLAIAIRMERLAHGGGISGNAVQLADKVVVNQVLRETKYIE